MSCQESFTRQIVLDTETTGLDVKEGHRIIEIGCVELINRRRTGKQFHYYLNPERDIQSSAIKVHGISQSFVRDQPHFEEIAEELYQFIHASEIIAHNAPFDIGFLNAEFERLNFPFGRIENFCQILDTLSLARKLHPGQPNNLDALMKRYHIRSIKRNLHGALLDAEILTQVYLQMTSHQMDLMGLDEMEHSPISTPVPVIENKPSFQSDTALRVILASVEELKAHENFLRLLKSD